MTTEQSALVAFPLLLACIIVAAKAAGWASVRAAQPAVLGEILAGVLLGPSLLNFLEWPIFMKADLGGLVAQLANIGVIFLMFLAGLETDLARMRQVGTVATLAGVAGVFVPLLLGLGVSLAFGYPADRSLYFGIVLTATSVSITVQTLVELGQLGSKEGITLLAAAVIDDVIALIILSAFLALSTSGGGLADLGVVLVRMLVYFVLAIAGGALVLRQLLTGARRLPVSEGLLAAAVVLVLIYSWAAEAVGHVAMITGAYIIGVLLSQAGFREEIEHRIHGFVHAILVPVFFISIGLQTNARALEARDLPFALLIVIAAVAGKIVGCGGGALIGGFTMPEALRIGSGMVSRGEVGLIVAAIGLQAALLAHREFAIMVFMVMATTLVTPVLLKLTFPRRPIVAG